jgi:hypothetical protein
MRKIRLPLLAVAGSSFIATLAHAQFADAIVAYTPGSGVGASFTNGNAALGQPARVNPFGESVDPFNPPYGTNQIVSVGAGGSLTVQFNSPILNHPANPFGADFIVFGNSGFVITNGDFTGGGITDGSLFGNNTGETRLWVSLDNITYYQLNPALAPNVDTLLPTDSSGDFQQPAAMSLDNADFGGQNLAGVRSLYEGSAGGAGFDISWAQDGSGNSVNLPGISFIRVDVLTGKSEIDAFSVVPEPASWALACMGIGVIRARRRFARGRHLSARRQ